MTSLDYVRQAIVALSTAGTALLLARDGCRSDQANELMSALREDIKTMLGDAEALKQVMREG